MKSKYWPLAAIFASSLLFFSTCKKEAREIKVKTSGSSGSSAPVSGTTGNPVNETYVVQNGIYSKKTIQYKSLRNIDSTLLSLDIYSRSNVFGLRRPVVIYVHGGGWYQGDKANQIANKVALFNSLNYVFVSVNYRLSPYPFEIANFFRIRYPDHNNDVADAVKWVIDSISKYGGNPSRIVLLGHSAGAHLVSLTGTSQLFLPARGVPVHYIRGIASIDTEGYDITTQSSEATYKNAFGNHYNTQVQASPIYNVKNGFRYPRYFIAKRGTAARIALSDSFISKLRSANVIVSQVNGSIYDHNGINNAIGDPNDKVITPALEVFLQQCFLHYSDNVLNQ